MAAPAGTRAIDATGQRPTEAVVLGALAVHAALAIAVAVPLWPRVTVADLAVAATFVAATRFGRRSRRPVSRFALRTGAVALALLYLFDAMRHVQLVLHGGFLDASLDRFETSLLGQQPVLWLQHLVRPWLTEWLMFAYVAYVALYPVVCVVVWRRHGEAALERCLLALAVANVACDAGFVLFPVAGPAFALADRLTVPLAGGPFTAVGELIRTHLHYPGGSLPSPHCAAATALWLLAWRYHRGLAVALAPVVLSLFAATVYGRYHYASDAVTGVVTGVLAVVAASHWLDARGTSVASR